MTTKTVHIDDKNQIEAFLRKNVFLNIYSLGDLDDFFRPYTNWYALTNTEGIKAIVLVYMSGSLPCLHALTESENIHYMEELLQSLIPIFPERFYAHLSLGLEGALGKHYSLKSHGEHYKMALTKKYLLSRVDTSEVIALSISDLDEIVSLFEAAYPENWFDPRLLDTNQYYGIRESSKLISVAGVHVYSRRYRVAALGNITTHPEYRGKGYGTAVTAGVCKSLLREIDHVGLNVKTDNTSAIRCYEKLGFEILDSYGEYEVEHLPS
ncbi:MAG: GNAT family N-acetyltransferase [Phycisphaerae bacterium]|nr:GNAT family N-acetyltransferase [Phycisphaerae bacterium]NIP51209.1 GNAT family N-acetyltransferase [Phycisphaerae bacterium]NIS50420.1 GNAT family N-acetyltransferase [Phycisphaerae bacterium]NIU08150.1 GNAT family N-acetyltransferase [Phycisphaerae bacterium]NIU55693.1 GNAT family N-acetyltransferase [Phycisphaerae bacterium]